MTLHIGPSEGIVLCLHATMEEYHNYYAFNGGCLWSGVQRLKHKFLESSTIFTERFSPWKTHIQLHTKTMTFLFISCGISIISTKKKKEKKTERVFIILIQYLEVFIHKRWKCASSATYVHYSEGSVVWLQLWRRRHSL